MRSRIIASSLAALSLVGAPVAAQAAPADRSSAPTTEENELMGGNILRIIIAIAAVVAAVLLLDGKDNPTSP